MVAQGCGCIDAPVAELQLNNRRGPVGPFGVPKLAGEKKGRTADGGAQRTASDGALELFSLLLSWFRGRHQGATTGAAMFVMEPSDSVGNRDPVAPFGVPAGNLRGSAADYGAQRAG
jgi:hypothetical protein